MFEESDTVRKMTITILFCSIGGAVGFWLAPFWIQFTASKLPAKFPGVQLVLTVTFNSQNDTGSSTLNQLWLIKSNSVSNVTKSEMKSKTIFWRLPAQCPRWKVVFIISQGTLVSGRIFIFNLDLFPLYLLSSQASSRTTWMAMLVSWSTTQVQTDMSQLWWDHSWCESESHSWLNNYWMGCHEV